MKRTLLELDHLQNLINLEKNKYKDAIRNDQKFEDVKEIYLNIKQLQKQADTLMRQANQLHKTGKSN